MELNREQIVKALECCSAHPPRCVKCPYQGVSCCTNEHRKGALALIRELTEENERFRAKGSEWRGCADTLFEEIKRVKADTVRKMQERLHIAFRSDDGAIRNPDCYVRYVVDRIVKEMLEEG